MSLARSLGFTLPSGDLRREDVALAVCSLCWFGIQKIRYFGMERFAKFLQNKSNRESFWQFWENARRTDTSKPTKLGTNDFEVFETRTALIPDGSLDDLMQKWLCRFRPDKKDGKPHKNNRDRIREMAVRWKNARKLDETRL